MGSGSFRAVLLGLAAGAAIAAASPEAAAQAAEAAPCQVSDVSPRADKKIKQWYRKTARLPSYRKDDIRDHINSILSDIQAESQKDKYTCRDREAFYGASIFVSAESPDPLTAAAALDVIVQSLEYDDSGTKEEKLRTLIHKLRDAERPQALVLIDQRERAAAPASLKPQLTWAHAIGLLGQDRPAEALDLLLPLLDTFGEEDSRTPFRTAYAIALHQGDEALAAEIEARAETYFSGFDMPPPHPLAGNDLLETMKMRLIGTLLYPEPGEPPRPSYPSEAASHGMEGYCDVHFDIDTRGRPMNVDAECSDREFRKESEKAVAALRFDPLIVDGQAYERHAIIYPLEYQLED